MTSIPFTSPCTVVISGPTGSGKSTFTFKILRNLNNMFSYPINKVYYFYSVWQKSFETEDIKKIEFIKDIPNQESTEKISNNLHNLIIIDYLQMSALNSEFIANLFAP